MLTTKSKAQKTRGNAWQILRQVSSESLPSTLPTLAFVVIAILIRPSMLQMVCLVAGFQTIIFMFYRKKKKQTLKGLAQSILISAVTIIIVYQLYYWFGMVGLWGFSIVFLLMVLWQLFKMRKQYWQAVQLISNMLWEDKKNVQKSHRKSKSSTSN